MTGAPPMPTEIAVKFLPESDPLPDPYTCHNCLKVPTRHTTYEQFQAAFETTISFQVEAIVEHKTDRNGLHCINCHFTVYIYLNVDMLIVACRVETMPYFYSH